MGKLVDPTITKVRIHTTNSFMGLKFWEAVCTRTDGNINRFCIKLDAMQEKGVAKTLNSTKKVETWLNTEEGLKWINESRANVKFTMFGDFL